MNSYLEEIIKSKHSEVAHLKERENPFTAAFKRTNFSVIAEIKRCSPSVGAMASIADPMALAKQYEEAGAAAISVLTDAKAFGGSLDDLKSVAKQVQAPVLRKDFIVDPIQLAETVKAGAQAVLLIAAVLKENLASCIEKALTCQLAPLVEVHDETELALALASGAMIIGVNNRNLHTFQTDLAVAEALRPLIPSYCIAIAESGIKTIEDADRMAAAGYDAILVGEALVRSPCPGQLIKDFRSLR